MVFALLAPPAPRFLPRVLEGNRAALGFSHWRDALAALEDPALKEALQGLEKDPTAQDLLAGIFANSPFLSDCLRRDTQILPWLFQQGPEVALRESRRALDSQQPLSDIGVVKAHLRQGRRQAALAIALADILHLWSVDRVIGALSQVADDSLTFALAFLLRQAAQRGEIALKDAANPTTQCGFTVLGLGKLGAHELNFSSDVDLIVLYEPSVLGYRGSRDVAEFAVRLTRDLVQLLTERTGDGYAYRVDLRLRPDPGATPLAISYGAALAYYESMGQNWERAAMIKARPVAGDLALGQSFLAELRPFMWRRSLDFLAIQDIHSIKRQIHAHKGGARIAMEGHNIKLGRGGIREIEFFAQTQQLIWGGRNPGLRAPATKAAIHALAEAGHVKPDTAQGLCDSYDFLRRVEHRLQMVEDQQTHSLPDSPAGMAQLAAFLAYDDVGLFRADLLEHLHRVEDHYAELFEESPSLSGPGNLVFTGGEPEPGTVETLTKLGFQSPETVFNLVRSWHHGRYRAMRSQRARELLTEIMPHLLGAFGETANPDQALSKFDEFLGGLPAGVQLFALLMANPKLLNLLAEVMGTAPALADHLSRRPSLLDAVLSPGFFDGLPDEKRLTQELAERLATARDFQDVLDYTRRWAADRRFQAGLYLLRRLLPEAAIAHALSNIADGVVRALLPPVTEELERQHGTFPGKAFCVVALGRLGSREMSVSSDLDLLFLYEAGADTSDGPKPLDAMTYFSRLSQRLTSALTALTGEGQLYAVDLRLRPSGNAGPIATTLAGFERYQRNEAWTWEHMALTRARVIAGDTAFAERVTQTLGEILKLPRDPAKVTADVADMRRRLERDKPARNAWDIKMRPGGLLDHEFLAQWLQLCYGPTEPKLFQRATDRVLAAAAGIAYLTEEEAAKLSEGVAFLRRMQSYMRLTLGDASNPAASPPALQQNLAKALGALDFPALERTLEETAARARDALERLVLKHEKDDNA